MNYKINYLFGFTLAVVTHTSYALPTGGVVVSGNGTITTNGNNLAVNQGSHKAIIDWRGFGIANNERVDFYQPNSNSITLNRITGGDISHINGQLNANGKLFLVNSNGIVFGKNSQINVSGLLATTSQITNSDFNASNYKFANTNPNTQIINNGNISINDAGFASLVAPVVKNNGVITARLGKVVLSSADAFTLDLYGDGLIQFDVSKQVKNGFVGNSGKIISEGGLVVLVIEAKSASVKDGIIILAGGNSGEVLVSGELNAKKVKVLGNKVGLLSGTNIKSNAGEVLIGGNFQGKGSEQNAQYTYVDKNAKIEASNENGNGGKVIVWADKNTQFYGEIKATGNNGNGGFAEVSGKENLVFRGKVDLTSKGGKKGTLLLDPKNITIANGGTDVVDDNDMFAENSALNATFDANLIVTALDGANLVLQANNDITVNEAIDSSGGGIGDLTLLAGRSIAVNANIKLNGAFMATVNDENAVAANRDAGNAKFTLGGGRTIDTTTGNKNITIDYENGANGNDATGTMSLVGSLNAGSGNIILETTANDGGTTSYESIDVDGAIVANDLSITGNQISLNTVTLADDLILNAKGNVFQNAAWSVDGTTTLNAGTNNITLDNINNEFATLDLKAKNATIKDKNALILAASELTGDLNITTATGVEINGNITTNGKIDITGNTTLGGNLLSNGNNITLENVIFSGGVRAINSNGGNIKFTKITGTDNSRLRLLAGGENSISATGGTINGEVDVNELFISGKGGMLTGSLRSINPNNGRKAAQSIGTSPVPHSGDFTFNGYRIIGREVEGESKRRFSMPVISKLSSNKDDLLFVMSNSLSKYTPENLDITSSGISLFSNNKNKDENENK
ncbi:Filamentous haemagglutinin domain protein [hydrothermal vent metagenome]|uniref:Filamentous haemagglutinin domain protein n=1 Tax=hydrothermal vent metagenome TaxID=652676 RepID=A0A1W1E486_9ZZZZ